MSWKISYYVEAAAEEAAVLFEDHDVKKEIKRILRVLVQEDDPRIPSVDAGLIVDELSHDAPGWYRVKVPRYAIRIVFTLLVVEQGKVRELGQLEPVPPDMDDYFIGITQMGFRSNVYGEELRRRWRNQHDE